MKYHPSFNLFMIYRANISKVMILYAYAVASSMCKVFPITSFFNIISQLALSISENLTPSFTLLIAFRFASFTILYISSCFYLELLQRILFLSYLNSNNYKLHLCLKLYFSPSYLSIITLMMRICSIWRNCNYWIKENLFTP